MQNDSQKGSLGNRFDQLSVAPSAGLWDAISSNLDENKKRRGIIWWWLGSGIAAIALISLLIYPTASDSPLVGRITSNGASKPADRTQNKIDNDLSRSFLVNEVDQHTQAENSTDQGRQSTQNNEESNGVDLEKSTNRLKKETAELIVQKNEVDSVAPSQQERLVQNEKVEKFNVESPELLAISTHSTSLIPLEDTPKKGRNWEIGIAANSWVSQSSSLSTTFENDFADSTSLVADLNNFSSLVRSSRKPIGLAFHLGYQFNSRFRIVSGLNAEMTVYRYENTVSALETADFLFNEPSKNAIRIYSIGLPIGLEYDVLNAKRFRFGVGFNVLNEIPILQSYLPNFDANYTGKEANIRTFISGYHFGLNPNLNLSYCLSEKLKMQINPGIRWYANQNTNTDVILPQRKMWFGGTLRMVWDI